MRPLAEVLERIRSLIFHAREEQEMTEELRFHLEMETEKNVRSGMEPAEARRQAQMRFGGVERFKEEVRDARGVRLLDDLRSDLRYAARTLRHSAGFSVTAILTLALGIAATTTIFSVVHGVMWKRLPVPEADELVSIVRRSSQVSVYGPITFPDYRDYRALDAIFRDVTAFSPKVAQVTFDGVPERTMIVLTTGNYFTTLGLQPRLGRAYTAEEGDIGGEPVVVLGHGYWQSRFSGDTSILGKTLKLNGWPVTVIGVTPRAFPGTIGFVSGSVYAPLAVWNQVEPELEQSLNSRSTQSWRAIGRLNPGVNLEQARAAVSSVDQRLEREYPTTNKDARAFLFPEPLTRLEPSAAMYLPIVSTAFLAMVGLVCLIACANVASLLLARALGRGREMAMRTALGAGRRRLLRQLLTESTLLAVAGGVLGLGMAQIATQLLASVRVANDLPLQFDFSIDYRVFAFSAAVTLVVGMLAGLAPGLHAVKANLTEALKDGGRGSISGARQPLRSALVATQVAVSLVLLISTALFVQSMRNVTSVDPGFEIENRSIFSFDAGLRRYDEQRGRTFYRDLLQRVRALPGVRSAATALSVPVGFNLIGGQVYLDGEGDAGGEQDARFVLVNIVSSDYFSTMGVDVLSGRPITDEDREGSRLVAVVNQRMAELFWPDREALGMRFSYLNPEAPALEVVGVAENGFYSVPGESYQPHFWVAFAQRYSADQTLFVHAEDVSSAIFRAVRAEINGLDPDMPVFDVRTLESHYVDGKAALLFRLPAVLVASFALIGIVLAVTGLYGVIAYSVGQRTREIGVRIALGATTGGIVLLVSRGGLWVTGAGIAAGLALSSVATNVFGGLLVGVGAHDVPTYAGVAVLVLAVAVLACAIPARLGAGALDPVDALRGE